jgi:membrane fusion protein, multidrug efflux system
MPMKTPTVLADEGGEREVSPPPEPRPRRSRSKIAIWIVAIVGILVVIGVLVGIKAGQIKTMIDTGKSFTIPPESVTSATAEVTEWEGTRSAVGTLVAYRAVTMSAEIGGAVRQIAFDSGQAVKKGALLVKLDTSTEEAQLASARAEAALAKTTLLRARTLRQSEANTQADLDAADAKVKQTDAAVQQLEATIAKKTIRAPFDGRLAIRQVELGQVVAPGTAIASLQSVTPIHADFWLPQQALADVKVGQKTRVHVDIYPKAQWDGRITTVNPEVDPATRNVRVRATFENPDGRLKPGMFASVEVLSNERHKVVVVPATAVIFAPYGDSVYVIEQKSENGKTSQVVRQKFVRVGDRRGDFVSVSDGLSGGEQVVSSGAFKLRNGMAVVVNNTLAPPAKLAPNPQDR